MSEEEVTLVDENNVVIGTAPRSEMRKKNLWHRGTYILVFNKKGELLVHQRTFTKDVHPGYFSIAAGGTVASGESYEENARRELEEELGIKNTPIHHLFTLKLEGDKNKVFGAVFNCQHEGPFVLQKEEVLSAEFLSYESILEKIKTVLFKPEDIQILKEYRRRFSWPK